MTAIPCLLCGAEIRKRRDKHGKPYFVCEPCGVQLFIRRKQGIENLDELMKQLSMHEFHFREHTYVLCEIQAVLAEMRGVKKEIKSLESEFDLFSSAKDKKEKKRTLELRAKRMSTMIRGYASRAASFSSTPPGVAPQFFSLENGSLDVTGLIRFFKTLDKWDRERSMFKKCSRCSKPAQCSLIVLLSSVGYSKRQQQNSTALLFCFDCARELCNSQCESTSELRKAVNNVLTELKRRCSELSSTEDSTIS
jgi:hypothetical protein